METDKDIEAKEQEQEQPRLSGAYIRSLVKHLTSKDSSEGSVNGECFHDVSSKQPQQHKKQVRRRLHTTKPYQQRLLNMAEARREIVTALKFHRASMKQAANNCHQPPPQPPITIHSLYPPTAAAHSYSPYAPPPPLPPPSDDYWADNQNFVLPSQTLGLNLNFQSFSNLDTNNIYHKQPMSPSTDLHDHAMDGDEMRSLGEQHLQIEYWNDHKINLVTSKTMEVDDHVMEFPPWLINASESSGLLDDHFSHTYFQDPALPCMDIGEIEAMDGEWLA